MSICSWTVQRITRYEWSIIFVLNNCGWVDWVSLVDRSAGRGQDVSIQAVPEHTAASRMLQGVRVGFETIPAIARARVRSWVDTRHHNGCVACARMTARS